jgi:hypothetical protein
VAKVVAPHFQNRVTEQSQWAIYFSQPTILFISRHTHCMHFSMHIYSCAQALYNFFHFTTLDYIWNPYVKSLS